LEGRPILRLKLTNRSPQPVEIQRRELPWNSDGLLQLIAVVESDLGMSLPFAESVGHIYDLSAVVLEPGESLEGKVELLHRFPTLLDMEHRRALLIFWSYDFGWNSPAPSQPAMGGIRVGAKELEGFSHSPGGR
jgi:hypothetical protein